MSKIDRREFLDYSTKTSLTAATGLTILANAKSVRGTPAADTVVLAMVGVGGRGNELAKGFLERGDCRIAYLCDPNSSLFDSRIKTVAPKQGGKEPACVPDFRKALDDKAVDAVIIATPDHWHALASIWACQAGKDVYVEKPTSHDCWEGQKMLEAARKYERVMQVGTQNRSAPYNMAARKYIEDGRLGKIHMCRVYDQKMWLDRPAVPDTPTPPGLDWDLWSGAAPLEPYNLNRQHYWHHFWCYSGGDIANDSAHQLDLARWLTGVTYPKSAYSVGGRWAEPGVAETPGTQVAVWEYPEMLMTFELTLYTPYMLKTDPVVRNSDMFPYWPQSATRIELYGTEGLMLVGRMGGGWQVFVRTSKRKPVVKDQMYGRFPDPEHKANFIDCIRTRERPTADIEEGHRSVLLTHYANISYRLGGQKLLIDAETERIKDNPEAMKLFRREYRAPYVVPEEV